MRPPLAGAQYKESTSEPMSVIASIVSPDMDSAPVPEEVSSKRRSSEVEEPDTLVVAKAVRALHKSLPIPANCGPEAMSAINTKLKYLVMEAASRAHENGRKTLKPADV